MKGQGSEPKPTKSVPFSQENQHGTKDLGILEQEGLAHRMGNFGLNE
jgi:hypothetical protein